MNVKQSSLVSAAGWVIALVGIPIAAFAQQSALNNSDVSSYWILGAPGKVVQDDGIPGGSAQTITVPASEDIWSDSTHSAVTTPIKRGDHLIVTAWLKAQTSEGKPGHANIKLEEDDAPYNAVGQLEVSPSSIWKAYSFTLDSKKNYAPNSLSLVVQYGDTRQTISVGEISVVNTPGG